MDQMYKFTEQQLVVHKAQTKAVDASLMLRFQINHAYLTLN